MLKENKFILVMGIITIAAIITMTTLTLQTVKIAKNKNCTEYDDMCSNLNNELQDNNFTFINSDEPTVCPKGLSPVQAFCPCCNISAPTRYKDCCLLYCYECVNISEVIKDE